MLGIAQKLAPTLGRSVIARQAAMSHMPLASARSIRTAAAPSVLCIDSLVDRFSSTLALTCHSRNSASIIPSLVQKQSLAVNTSHFMDLNSAYQVRGFATAKVRNRHKTELML